MLTARGLLSDRAPRELHVPVPSIGLRHFTRLFAFAGYAFALLAAFAILAPVLPSGYQGAAYDVRSVVPGLSAPADATPPPATVDTRSKKVRNGQSVALFALRAGTTPFELYALNPNKLAGPFIEQGTRIRIPR